MTFDVLEKVALVTGGAEGIGFSFVENLLQNGAKGVAIVDINEELGIRAEDYFKKKFGIRVKYIKTNVAVPEELERAFRQTCQHFKNLDIVINNAGLCNDFQLDSMLAINLAAVIKSTQIATEKYLPAYQSTPEAVIVNLSSITAITPFSSCPFYTATKAGVLNLGRAYGHEAIYKKFGVKVITVCPGYTETKMTTNPTGLYFPETMRPRNKIIWQKPEVVAGFLSKIIRRGNNGSVWIVDQGEVYKMKFPSLEEVKKASEKYDF